MGLFLGLDIGTTKDAAVLVDCGRGSCAASAGVTHRAGEGDGLQNVDRHLSAVLEAVSALPEALRKQVCGIGVSTQMHGVLCRNAATGETSPLYSWQSRVEDLEALRELPGCARLRHGFGGATLGMLARCGELEKWTECLTIGDWFVQLFTGVENAFIDRSDAASWGLMEFDGDGFDPEAVDALGIPAGFLPRVLPVGATVGRLTPEWSRLLGVPEGVEVKAALGDNQASVLAALRDPEREISLTLGTGAQISVVIPNRTAAAWRGKLELRPFLGTAALAVGAPLCGGAAWAALAGFLKSGLAAANRNIDDDALFRILDAEAERELEAADLPQFSPSFLGERDDPAARGELSGLTLDNFRIGKVAAALPRGIAENLRRMLPEALLDGKSRLAASGNGFRRNRSLCRAAELVFGIPLVQSAFTEEAACGAALLFAHTNSGSGD